MKFNCFEHINFITFKEWGVTFVLFPNPKKTSSIPTISTRFHSLITILLKTPTLKAISPIAKYQSMFNKWALFMSQGRSIHTQTGGPRMHINFIRIIHMKYHLLIKLKIAKSVSPSCSTVRGTSTKTKAHHPNLPCLWEGPKPIFSIK